METGRNKWAGAAGLIATIGALAILAPAGPAVGKGGGGGGGGGGSECKNAETPIKQLSTTAARKTIACMLNEERRRHGRSALKKSKTLQKVAQKHTKKMVQTDCLSHQCPGEADLETRIKQSGYTNGASNYTYGENTGCGLSAKAMVANWMASQFHRINILDKDFNDLGVGFSPGRVPSKCASGYGTFTTVFGYYKK